MRLSFGAISVAVTIVAVGLGCHSVQTSDDVLLRNPSFHILVKDGVAPPEAATFDFATKVFKVDDGVDFDVARAERRLTEALEAELAGKDYRRVATEPEILVSFAVAVDATLSAADLEAAYAEEFPVDFPDMSPDQQLHYHQGALIVDFVDRGSQALLWRGAIHAGLDMEATDDVRERRIREAVRILLRHFPRPILGDGADPAVAAP